MSQILTYHLHLDEILMFFCKNCPTFKLIDEKGLTIQNSSSFLILNKFFKKTLFCSSKSNTRPFEYSYEFLRSGSTEIIKTYRVF